MVNTVSEPVRLSALDIQESYKVGWQGIGTVSTPPSRNLGVLTMMFLAVRSSVTAGATGTVLMSIEGANPKPPVPGATDFPPGTIVRMWPSVVTRVEPLPSSETDGGRLAITFTDPVSYLAQRPIWGAYRLCSAAEMIGGAISLANGGDGKPTLVPALPGLPAVRITNKLREDLDIIPYSVAAGESFGIWLDRIEQMLGIHSEMVPKLDGSIEMILTDKAPTGRPLQMQLTVNRNVNNDAISSAPNGQLYISAIESAPGIPARSVVLDDSLYGSFKKIGGAGSIGSVENSPGVSMNEAIRRAENLTLGVFSEMLQLKARSKQPAFRPGRLVQFSQSVGGMDSWQIILCRHQFRTGDYDNSAVLIDGANAWYPTEINNVPPTYVTALVDGGKDYAYAEPVPRDRLGRIPIKLSFLPTLLEDEGIEVAVADENEDGRITLSDFDEAQLADYTENRQDWAMKASAYNNNEYADPFPGETDEDLTEEQLEQRTANRDSREEAIRYLASRRALQHDAKDRDQDGYISSRDEVISDELSILLDEPGSRERVSAQLAAKQAGTLTEDFDTDDLISDDLLDEYDSLFGDGPGEGEEDPHGRERRDAQVAQDRWPVRIPVTAIEPMAGGLHGFIPGHRHGDICRIIVHSPLFIELVGYQYRGDRPINAVVVGASAGMVIEHNHGPAWSGILFKPTKPAEAPAPEEGAE